MASRQLEAGVPTPQMKTTWTRTPAEENGCPRTAK